MACRRSEVRVLSTPQLNFLVLTLTTWYHLKQMNEKSRDDILDELAVTGVLDLEEPGDMQDLYVAAYRLGGPPSRMVGAGEAAAPIPDLHSEPGGIELQRRLRARLKSLGVPDTDDSNRGPDKD